MGWWEIGRSGWAGWLGRVIFQFPKSKSTQPCRFPDASLCMSFLVGEMSCGSGETKIYISYHGQSIEYMLANLFSPNRYDTYPILASEDHLISYHRHVRNKALPLDDRGDLTQPSLHLLVLLYLYFFRISKAFTLFGSGVSVWHCQSRYKKRWIHYPSPLISSRLPSHSNSPWPTRKMNHASCHILPWWSSIQRCLSFISLLTYRVTHQVVQNLLLT